MRWLLAAVAVAIAALPSLAAGAERPARSSPGLIAFSRLGGIYVMRSDGSSVHPLRLGGVTSHADGLAWSPNGRKLAFYSYQPGEEGIWVMDADGRNLVRLVADGASPTWSPDGRTIAFVAYRNGNRDIWIANADGSNQRRLARTPHHSEGELDWSPAGGRVVYTELVAYIADLYVMNTNGSNLRLLTPGRFEGVEPHWSPDGGRIAFRRWQGTPSQDEIYVDDLDAHARIRLTNDMISDRLPAWSPDGKQIVFVRIPAKSDSSEIYVINADGTGLRRLTHNNVEDTSPAWRPVAPS